MTPSDRTYKETDMLELSSSKSLMRNDEVPAGTKGMIKHT